MNVYPISQDDYSVEEISYEDMMSILSSQKHVLSDFHTDEKSFESDNSKDHALKVTASEGNEFSQRIAENANRQLPDWLLGNA